MICKGRSHMTKVIQAYIQEHTDELFSLLRELCAIPAPSHHEEKRAEFCKSWLESAGAEGVYIDDAKNVVFPYACEGSEKISVFFAHTDTVFPDTEPMPLTDDGELLRCPGICDDTANLAVLMMTVKFLLGQNITPPHGILFVCNSCEEGLGNLKGARQIFSDYAGRVKQFVTFDGHFSELADRCVGSHRYEVELRTEGGHSYEAFGNRNAIAELSRLVTEIYDIKVPVIGNSKTTYNVGMITGGTSVNTIAQNCEFLLECRSDNAECLKKMQRIFENMITAFNESISGEGQNGVTMETVGIRPCSEIDPAKETAVAEKYAALLKRHTGKDVSFGSASTDCNIPLSMGIPAVCFGGYSGHGAHTREEYIEIESMKMGYEIVLDVLSM